MKRWVVGRDGSREEGSAGGGAGNGEVGGKVRWICPCGVGEDVVVVR